MDCSFPDQGHIKGEPIDGYEQKPGGSRLAAIPLESRQRRKNLTQPEGLKQTLAASFHHVCDTSVANNRAAIPRQAPSSLPQRPILNENRFHIPPIRCLAETAGVGGFDLNLPPMMPRMQARPEDRHIAQFLCQDPQIPPDGAFLHSSNVSLRNPSWPAGQYALPHFPRENAFALDDGHTYPQDMPAPRVLPHTVDPSSLLPRHFSMSGIQDESVSGSENEKENEDELNSGWPHRLDGDTYDANGWLGDPGTIRLGVPGFGDTKPKADLRDAAGVQVPVEIHAGFVLKRKAAIQRYFTILYRRNYFSIQASFTFRPPLGSSSDETLYLYGESHRRERIQAIFMCMRGVVETEEGPEIKIVVFNAKRKPLYEGDNPPPIDPQRMKPLTDGSTKFYTKSTGDRHDHINVPMNHTFPRNQFRAATQNNGARRTEQQFYRILLELKAEILVNGSPRLSTIASKLSDSLVVRGRCPLSFKEKDDASGPDRIGGHTRDSDRKGRKPPRREGGKGSKEASTRQIQEEGSTIGASRGFCNGTGPSSRLSTRASTGLMNLTPGTRSWSCDTAPVSPLPTSRAHGTVNGQTIPSIGSNLLTLVQEDWQGDRPGG